MNQVKAYDWLEHLTEPAVVVAIDGAVVAANVAFRQMVSRNQGELRRLQDVAVDPEPALIHRLRRWARTKQPAPGSLRLHLVNGEATLAVSGGRISGISRDEPATILLRCRPRPEATERFRLLGDKIDALSREVLARRRAEAQAWSQREWFRTTLASIGDAVITTDCDGRITFMNRIAEELTGWSMEDATHVSFVEVFRIIDERTREAAEDPCEKVLTSGDKVALANHTALIARDGTIRGIEDTAAPIRDPEGAIQGVIVVFHDVTERRRIQEYIRQQEEWYRTTLTSVGDAVIATDALGHVVFINPVAEALTGWSLDDARGVECQTVFNIINEDTRQVVESPVARVIREGVIVGLANHTLLIARDGTERPIDDSGAPIRDGDGNLVGTVLVFRDITERKAAENALRESEQRFRTMADAAPVLIWVADTTKAYTYVNRQWLTFTGRTLEQETGFGWTAGVHGDERQRCIDHYKRAFDHREPFQVELRLRRRDGEYRWMLNHGVPRYDPDGTFKGYIGSCIDITDRRLAEAQLLSMNDLLERRVAERTRQLRDLAAQLTNAEQRERRRLAQILHDHLQQLLVAARMRVDIMVGRTDKPSLIEAAEQVRSLINQSVEASRSLTFELSPPVLYDGGLCAALPWLARRMEEHHDLHVEVRADTSAEPPTEEMRVTLFLAVRELLFNVVKHAGVRSARVDLSRQNDGALKVVVADDGAGFDASSSEFSDKASGLGLLSIRERLSFLGGSVEIDATPGGGTCVTLTVPQRQAAPASAERQGRFSAAERRTQAAASAGHRVIRVLLADDHRILREGIAGILLDCPDMEVVGEATDGQEAVDLARTHLPDVVVMDITMPRMSGIEATRVIRRELPSVAVVGLSMHEQEDMAAAMTDAGAECLLPKDGPSQALLDAIRQAASGAGARESRPSA